MGFVCGATPSVRTVGQPFPCREERFPRSPVALGGDVLIYGGLATLALGATGMLTAQQPRRLAGFGIILSSGTLLAVIGFAHAAMMGAALFYLLGSTLAASALFLLGELIERSRAAEAVAATHDDKTDHVPSYVDLPDWIEGASQGGAANDEEALVGRAIPAAMAFLGLSFVACALMIAGLPPLSGFLTKFAILTALLDSAQQGTPASGLSMSSAGWTLLVLLIGSSLLATIALSRAGIRYFWAPQDRPSPHLRLIECAPIAALLLLAAVLTVRAEPVLLYTQAATASLLAPAEYINAVMRATPVPDPVRAPPISTAGAAP